VVIKVTLARAARDLSRLSVAEKVLEISDVNKARLKGARCAMLAASAQPRPPTWRPSLKVNLFEFNFNCPKRRGYLARKGRTVQHRSENQSDRRPLRTCAAVPLKTARVYEGPTAGLVTGERGGGPPSPWPGGLCPATQGHLPFRTFGAALSTGRDRCPDRAWDGPIPDLALRGAYKPRTPRYGTMSRARGRP